jgi:hypothetical protein
MPAAQPGANLSEAWAAPVQALVDLLDRLERHIRPAAEASSDGGAGRLPLRPALV